MLVLLRTTTSFVIKSLSQTNQEFPTIRVRDAFELKDMIAKVNQPIPPPFSSLIRRVIYSEGDSMRIPEFESLNN